MISNRRALLHIRAAEASFSLTSWQHSTLLLERTPWPWFWNYDVKAKIGLR